MLIEKRKRGRPSNRQLTEYAFTDIINGRQSLHYQRSLTKYILVCCPIFVIYYVD